MPVFRPASHLVDAPDRLASLIGEYPVGSIKNASNRVRGVPAQNLGERKTRDALRPSRHSLDLASDVGEGFLLVLFCHFPLFFSSA